ncbi:MAG: YncE family protein, partial [Acidimicrobiaceae bacterium]|nr:YncE family protein [Acidimicrobiaceae bacterium]
AATGAVTATIDVGNALAGVAFDGTHIWVTNLIDGTVSKIVASTGAVTATITVGNNPSGVAFDGTHMWVANGSDDTVSKIPVG